MISNPTLKDHAIQKGSVFIASFVHSANVECFLHSVASLHVNS